MTVWIRVLYKKKYGTPYSLFLVIQVHLFGCVCTIPTHYNTTQLSIHYLNN
jgi:hypothetical protein